MGEMTARAIPTLYRVSSKLVPAPMAEQKPDYTRCWGHCLGDCNGGMSQEHLVSECLYERAVKVKGLPWCMDDWKFLSIENVTSRILCRHHNTALSVVDDGARHTLDIIGRAFDLWEVRKKILTRRWTLQYFETDMLLFERWCLKTLININLNHKPGIPVDPEGKSTMPTEELVRIAFGLDIFKPPKGLYMMVSDQPENRTVNLMEGEMTIQTNSCNDRLSGAQFDMWGMKFLLNLYPDTLKWNQGRLIRGAGMKHMFQTRDHKQRLVDSHLVTFT